MGLRRAGLSCVTDIIKYKSLELTEKGGWNISMWRSATFNTMELVGSFQAVNADKLRTQTSGTLSKQVLPLEIYFRRGGGVSTGQALWKSLSCTAGSIFRIAWMCDPRAVFLKIYFSGCCINEDSMLYLNTVESTSGARSSRGGRLDKPLIL